VNLGDIKDKKMRISDVEPVEVNKITDLIPRPILDLLLKGLSEKGATLVVEEKDEEGIVRMPFPEETEKRALKTYWTPLCEYYDHFPSGKHECVADTQKRAREIIDGNITEPKVVYCHLGLSVVAIPFIFKDRVIGILFGGKKRLKGSNIHERLEEFVKRNPFILEEEAVWEENDLKWKDKKFDLDEAKRLVDSIPETSKEEFEKEREKLKDASMYIIQVGSGNYNEKRVLLNQQLLSEVMEYFLDQYGPGKKPLEDILKEIFDEIRYCQELGKIIFVWREEKRTDEKERYKIISSPLIEKELKSVDIDKARLLIENDLERKGNNLYFCYPKSPKVSTRGMLASLLKTTITHSFYVKTLSFKDNSSGYLLFIDPKNEGDNFSSDCAEFLNLFAERLRTQVNIYLTDKVKADFVAEITHRLKVPMQYLMDEVEYLERYCRKKYLDDSKIEATTQEIMDGILLLDHQIKNYSFISTMDEGKWSYNFQFHPIVTLIMKCVMRFEHIAQVRGIEIKVDTQDKDYDRKIRFDWDSMEMAIFHLLDNAVKYAHFKTHISLKIFFEEYKQKCKISIRNRGLGISYKEYERIFERYYRGEILKDPIRFIPGTGIGLAVVNEIIKAHQGEVSVDSRLLRQDSEKRDVYTNTFTIYLPFEGVKE